MAEFEERAFARADVVFVVARAVRDRLALLHTNVVLLPNGVEFERFSAPQPEPDELSALPKPRIIYVGALEYWLDAELVAKAAHSLPQASFIIVGPEAERTNLLSHIPNVHLLGPRPYERVAGYLQHSDVGIVPFVRDEMVDSIHPIKVYEYLAAGLRVVAVRWAELEAMGAPVVLTERAEFIDRLARVVSEADSQNAREARLAYARENSWDTRFGVVADRVAAVLLAKGA
jgi:glycosyltransferase involved in cell wall biosynthesis